MMETLLTFKISFYIYIYICIIFRSNVFDIYYSNFSKDSFNETFQRSLNCSNGG